MKPIKYLMSALALTLSFNILAATRYVSDDIHIYLHSGPSLDYRIIGTVKVGSKLETLKYNSESKFMQVKLSSGKTGWVKSSEIQKTLPAKALLPTARKELLAIKDKLKKTNQQYTNSLDEKSQFSENQETLIANLQGEKDALQQNILDLKAKNLELDLLQDTKEERIQMEWMLNGGGVLFFGLVIGLIIPFIPRRKKRTNNW